jgi:acyl-CoA synthetase (AMP-forming)/AMP-acid ligase II
MPKTIAITPSWYWPASTTRVCGVPPFRLDEHLAGRWARRQPDGLALVDGGTRLSWSELAGAVDAAAIGLRAQVPDGGRALFTSGPSAEGVVLLLALARSGVPAVAAPPATAATVAATAGASVWVGDASGAAAAGSAGVGILRLADVAVAPAPGTVLPAPAIRAPLIGIPTEDSLAWHSSRSLLGAAVSMQAYYSVEGGRPWLSTLDVSDWQGIVGAIVPLAAGATAVLAPPGEAALDAVARESIGTSVWRLEHAFAATRESKRQVKSIRGVQERVVLFTGRTFDPDQRRRVGKLFEAPALTVFGLPETGPVFASHPSWYLDESVGIPISNAWVVPVDPRTANPIPTLWELVEKAMVTVGSASLTVGYEGGAHAERFRDGRFLTGLIASSDANGMIYLLPD